MVVSTLAASTTLTHADVMKAINKIEECKQRMNDACNRSCNETYSNVGTTMVGSFANSTSGAAGRVQECSNKLCAEGDNFITALRNAVNLLSNEDESLSSTVNAIDPFAGGAGGMGNFARLA